jgi:hypothetical protein
MDIVAIVATAILLPLCIATRNLQISEDHLAVRVIRRVAAATYPLYLIHSHREAAAYLADVASSLERQTAGLWGQS